MRLPSSDDVRFRCVLSDLKVVADCVEGANFDSECSGFKEKDAPLSGGIGEFFMTRQRDRPAAVAASRRNALDN